jgi:dihydroxyacetone kinase-like predicted kinase
MMRHYDPSSEPPSQDVLTTEDLALWCRRGQLAIRQATSHLNEINVFDRVDYDTGKNLNQLWSLLTETTETAYLERRGSAPMTPSQLLHRWARAASEDDPDLVGRSVIIISKALKGMAAAAANLPHLDSRDISAVLTAGAVSARQWLSVDAVDGTILDVLDAGADAATVSHLRLSSQLEAIAEASVRAVEGTTARLPILRQVGVVDAGALGLSLALTELPGVIAARPGR